MADEHGKLQLPHWAGQLHNHLAQQRQEADEQRDQDFIQLVRGDLVDRGDLGYFFKRSPATNHLDTGSIVALCDGQLSEPQPTGTVPGSTLYMVVSDDYVLIRAGRQPAEGEEGPSGSGHWVAWIGQVTAH